MVSAQKSLWFFWSYPQVCCLMVARKPVYLQPSHPVQNNNKGKTRTTRHVSFTIPSARTRNFPRNWGVNFCSYLVGWTCVTRLPGSPEAKIIEIWLSLFFEASNDVLSIAGHIVRLNTRKSLIARKEKGCEQLIGIKQYLSNATENWKYFYFTLFPFRTL